MKLNKLLVILLALLPLFTACTEVKDEETPSPAINQELLLNKNWRLTAYTRTSGTEVTDKYNEKKDCERDNITIFNADNTYIINEGNLRCGAADVVEEGIWEIIDGVLTTMPEESSRPSVADYKIEELSDKKLVYSSTFISNGNSAKESFTFIAQ